MTPRFKIGQMVTCIADFPPPASIYVVPPKRHRNYIVRGLKQYRENGTYGYVFDEIRNPVLMTGDGGCEEPHYIEWAFVPVHHHRTNIDVFRYIANGNYIVDCESTKDDIDYANIKLNKGIRS